MSFITQFIIEKIDFATLGILFCLMAVVEGFNKLGYIDQVAGVLVKRAKSLKMLILTMVLSSFFLSMLVTNDVALIIMVPFSIQVLHRIGAGKQMIQTVVWETIAANLGSMMTPIGNPQNVYLYSFYKMNMKDFFMALLPYGVISLLLLLIVICLQVEKGNGVTTEGEAFAEAAVREKQKLLKTVVYCVLFACCLLTVLGKLSCIITFGLVVIIVVFLDYSLFRKINYGLLIKFAILFVLVGSVADIPMISSGLKGIVSGNEFLAGVGLSQFLSNVPTAIMLSQFTTNGIELMLGVNVGGLGTLIASMASMISLEFYSKIERAEKKRYILSFTGYNILFLIVLLLYKFFT